MGPLLLKACLDSIPTALAIMLIVATTATFVYHYLVLVPRIVLDY